MIVAAEHVNKKRSVNKSSDFLLRFACRTGDGIPPDPTAVCSRRLMMPVAFLVRELQAFAASAS